MDKRLIGYWLATALFCLAMAAGGTMNLLRVEPQQVAMEKLGYPEYLMTILGVAKILGVIALLAPGFPLLKGMGVRGIHIRLAWRLRIACVCR